MTPLLVALGGGVGAVLRWRLSVWTRRSGATPAGGTLVVNVLGSFLLGLIAGWGSRPDWVMPLFGVGLCGGLTTFSSHTLEVVQAWRDLERRHAVADLMSTLLLSVPALMLGWSMTL
ncbi:fluoride efflux transporter CrcB [Marihabitans asiaticum]|uniref:Fluoride-specific ion channel FluC n=1 Tax=Marihabitans asiaticum TaxID=415218 RepID=A0A560WED2_9MICO|nr:CrcB family protein [Marihabitans asiaticum]TWD15825.1 CrcB protein [Marihabitans asiaticum]